MKRINNKTYDQERALYALSDAMVENCVFSGEADGESALKEAKRICVKDCRFDLRYPLWHNKGFSIESSVMSETCRAPLWYSQVGFVSDVTVNGPKALRECRRIGLADSQIVSSEFGWKCNDISVNGCKLEGDYIFLESGKIKLSNIKLKGKYSLQYVSDSVIENSVLDTKDCLWHAKNVKIVNCQVNGEYLGWYSRGLTFVNCRISGTQPLCYCKKLKVIDCELTGCDLAFEYSDVKANIKGHIDSVKNPKSGCIAADSIGEVIRQGTVYTCKCSITTK